MYSDEEYEKAYKEAYEKAYKEGYEIGRLQAKKQAIPPLFKGNFNLKEIAELTDLSEEKVIKYLKEGL